MNFSQIFRKRGTVAVHSIIRLNSISTPTKASISKQFCRRLQSKTKTRSEMTTSQQEPFPHSETFRLVQQPHPHWQIGDPQPTPRSLGEEETSIEPSKISDGAMYHFLISSVVPRPIALVSSIDQEGTLNVAPFSYFNAVCHDPPTLMVSVNYGRNGMKDTLRNILETKEFVINMMSEHFVESANFTSAPYPRNVEENVEVGMEMAPSERIRVPRVKTSAVSFECTLSHVHTLVNDRGEETSGIVFGRIVNIVAKTNVLTKRDADGALVVDCANYKPVSRLGGAMYGRTTQGYEIPRPTTAPTRK